jgi:tripartite motif-containing protein 27
LQPRAVRTLRSQRLAPPAMEIELRCPVCHEYFEDPVMLQCAHHICAAHVAGLAGNSGLGRAVRSISCPACGDQTVVPEGGLRVDRTLQTVVGLRDSLLASTPNVDLVMDTTAPMCGFCEEQPATRRCMQCSGVLCEACEKTSHS